MPRSAVPGCVCGSLEAAWRAPLSAGAPGSPAAWHTGRASFFPSFSSSFIYEKKKKKFLFFFFLVCSWNNEVQISFMLERFDPGCARCGFAGGWEERWRWKRAGDGTSRSAGAGGASWAGWGCCRLGGGEEARSSPGQGSLAWVGECAAAVLAATLASPSVLGLAPKEVRLGTL